MTNRAEGPFAALFDEWRKAAADPFTYWQSTLDRAATGTRAAADSTAVAPRELTLLFFDVAETAFVELFETPEFRRAQGLFGNASMTYRLRERAVVDAVAKLGHFPTRTEVDEAHRNIHELRREVRALRRELRDLRRAAATEETAR